MRDGNGDVMEVRCSNKKKYLKRRHISLLSGDVGNRERRKITCGNTFKLGSSWN